MRAWDLVEHTCAMGLQFCHILCAQDVRGFRQQAVEFRTQSRRRMAPLYLALIWAKVEAKIALEVLVLVETTIMLVIGML